MIVTKFDDQSIDGLTDVFGLSIIWVLSDAEGHVLKEIGFGSDGTIKHRYPGHGPHGHYGIFDGATVEVKEQSDLDVDEFLNVWISDR